MTKPIIHPSLTEPILYTLPVGIGVFNADLIVEWMNSAVSTVFGYQPEEVIGKKWFSLIPATEERRQIYSRVLAGEALDYPEARSPLGEVERCFDLRYRPIRDQGKVVGVLITSLEITDRKQIERELLESQKKLRKLTQELDRIFSFSPDMICLASLEGRFTRVNAAFAKTLGHSEEELLSQPFIDFVHPEDQAETLALTARCAAGEAVQRFENRYRCKDGSYKWLAWRSVTDRQEGRIYAVARDMTDLKEMQQAAEVARKRADRLRNMYLRQVLSAQEEERRRIARELHDDMGSSLTSLLVGLRSLSQLEIPERAKTQLARLQEIAEAAVGSVSHLAHGLHPSALEDFGFRAAIERYAQEYAEVNQIRVHLYMQRSTAVDHVDLNVATALYRIVQEALANVAKHAEANNVSVIFHDEKDMIRLVIEDDGKGFPEASIEEPDLVTGIGIQAIRERLTLLGGSLTIESVFGGGTTLFVEVPFPGAAPQRAATDVAEQPPL